MPGTRLELVTRGFSVQANAFATLIADWLTLEFVPYFSHLAAVMTAMPHPRHPIAVFC